MNHIRKYLLNFFIFAHKTSKMRKLAYLLILSLSVWLNSCNSLDSDAQEAAKLNLKSLECAKNADLQKAEELYKQSQEIIAQYKGTEKYQEFYTAYNNYMEENIK